MMKVSYLTLFASAALLVAQTGGPKTFSTPEEARTALIQAATAGGAELKSLMGPESVEVLRTGDEAQDKELLQKFNQRVAEKAQLEQDPMNRDQITLLVGEEEWPFAIPLIRKNGRWHWDVHEGKAEIRRRTIGGNELDAIEICRGYVEAQQAYSETDWSGKGTPTYAGKIISSDGKKDGLYWPGDDSPVAAGFAKAAAQGAAPPGGLSPYHGYLYKILLGQGPDAQDGERDYMVHGLMIGGFALVAWPAEYGVSGIMTLIVNQDGVVYQKDLGTQTSALAKAMTKFNPDKSWEASPD